MHKALGESKWKQFFLCCSRRLGKSYEMVLEAIETSLKTQHGRALYLAPWAKDAADIASDLMVQILEDCPPELRPTYNAQQKEWRFPHNDALIRFKGVNGEHARYLRGGAAHIVILDEVGDMDDLHTVIHSVVLPMTMTTGGRIIMATTPAMSAGHESHTIFEELAGKNAVVTFTLRDAPHVSTDTKAEYLIEAGETPDDAYRILAGEMLPKTTAAQREYWCMWVTDSSKAVVPEWSEEVQKACVIDHPRPSHFDAYVSMDPGFSDRTGILFAYWDFMNAKLVIEDELLLHRANTQEITQSIMRKERELWGHKEPFMRVSDVDLRLIADLWNTAHMRFVATPKEDSLGAVNFMRTLVGNRQIIVHPRCQHTIRQLKNATWNNKATDFERTDKEGHYDLVAALKYLCRNIQKNRNPFPGGYSSGGNGSWTSPKLNRGGGIGFGLLDSTPFGRRIARRKG